MLHKNFLMTFLLIPTLLLSACATPEPVTKVVTVPTIVRQNIAPVARPLPVQLEAPQFYVVNAENYEEFVKNFEDKHGALVYVAFSVRDYESLSLNLAELRRYINQQNEVIVYYESAIKD
jgi:hypothetical protein